MARLVVALVALAIMSAGSMYWASAQQISDTGPATGSSPIKASALGAFQLAPASADPASPPAAGCPGCGGCGDSSACPKTAEQDKPAAPPPAKKRSGCCRGK